MCLPRLRVTTRVLVGWLLIALLAPSVGRSFVPSLVPPARAADVDPVGVWPLRPRPEVVRGFDPPEVTWGSGHRGVDLAGWPGQEVLAALAGTVTFAGMLAGRGVVVVAHGDTRTTYEPVLATVDVGTRVAQGARIGRLTYARSHCLPRACLHWGWLRDETYLDPLGLVGARPVRLLPLWRDQPVQLRSVPPWAYGVNPYSAVLAVLARLAARSPPGSPQARG